MSVTTILTAAEIKAIEAKAAADFASMPDYTEEEWGAIDARLDAKYRAKYKRECAEYREKFGEEPSLGTLIGAEARAECNNLTEEEEARLHAYGMAFYKASCATPHARHATRR